MTPLTRKLPAAGDMLKFKTNFLFSDLDMDIVEVPKDTLCEVISTSLSPSRYGDELEYELILAVEVSNNIRLFKFNYTIHQNQVKVLPGTEAVKILYGKKDN